VNCCVWSVPSPKFSAMVRVRGVIVVGAVW